MRFILTILLLPFFTSAVHAQLTPQPRPVVDTTTIFNDRFESAAPVNGIVTSLWLHHKLHYDMGDFELVETARAHTDNPVRVVTKGDWTVLKGDAKDDNATVVELDGQGKTLYYLRMKDGNLQKLDTSLHEIMPAQMLRKIKAVKAKM